MNQIYTAGYAGKVPAELQAVAKQLGALVIDTRLHAWSRQPGWKRQEMEDLLKGDYRHYVALGNVNYVSRGPHKLKHEGKGLAAIVRHAEERPVILLCACRDEKTCHRSHISQLLLEKYGLRTKPLEWPALPGLGVIKCLSLWQPWATLIAVGAKRIETRSWVTHYRGPLAIHAGKTDKGWQDIADYDEDEDQFHLRQPFAGCLREGGYRFASELPYGAIVAVAELVDCKPAEEILPDIDELERAFGNYTSTADEQRYGWILKDVRRLEKPLPYTGRQGLFEIDKSLVGL